MCRPPFVDLFLGRQGLADKPHLPFWLSAASFSLFGFSTWAYKAPVLILVFVAAFYTYAFAKVHYDKRIALAAAIIFLSAQHIVTSSNDVRAEAYLTAFVIGGVYHLHQASRLNSLANLVAGSAFAAAAVMTKGVFTLIPIGGAIGGGLLLGGRWAEALHARWLAAALLILLFISPELYCRGGSSARSPRPPPWGRPAYPRCAFSSGITSSAGLRQRSGRQDGRQPVLFPACRVVGVSAVVARAIPGGLPGDSRAVGRRTPTTESFNLGGALATFLCSARRASNWTII